MDLFSSVQFKMVFMRSEKAHMRSIPSLRNFPNVAFETVPMFQGSLQYKRALISFHVVSCRASPYELLHLYSPSRSLRSAWDTRIFRVPRMGRWVLGERSFQYIGPVLWNSLTVSVRRSSSLTSFISHLETHLFSSASIIFFLLISQTRHQ